MKAAAFLLTLAIALGAPAAMTGPLHAQTAAPKLEVKFTKFTLPNGLTVILHEDHTVPIATVNVWYHVGSANEKPGRTGFAHLFEHLMFMGSGHVKYGEFDNLLEATGGDNNASTGNDRTNYYINVPSNALDLALYLESDRLGYLLDAMTPETVDAQRDVVKNERRQSVENRPYGEASNVTLGELLFPEGHPYHWPVIGYMPDLTAASFEDTVNFFKKYYTTGNASMVIAGDIDPAKTKALVEKWYADIEKKPAPEPVTAPPVALKGIVKKTVTDRVQLPMIMLAWPTPAHMKPGDAALDIVGAVLAGGKNSRLYKRLVYDMQIAQSVTANQQSQSLASVFEVDVIPRPGHTVAEVQKVVDEELQKLQREDPTAREFERAINQYEASFYNRLERTGGFGGVADQINAYYSETGNPDGFAADLARYKALKPADVKAAAAQYLPLDKRVELTVEPEKKQ